MLLNFPGDFPGEAGGVGFRPAVDKELNLQAVGRQCAPAESAASGACLLFPGSLLSLQLHNEHTENKQLVLTLTKTLL